MPASDPIPAIASLLEKAPPGVLATIASVRGSSPAPILSRMLVSAIGETVGTVGGGCLEAEVLLEAARVKAEGGWRRVAYTLDESEEELRMVCGGTVEILLESVAEDDAAMFRLLAARHAAGQSTLVARIFGERGDAGHGGRSGDAGDAKGPGDAAAAAGAGSSSRLLARGRTEPARLLLGEEGEVLWGGGALPAPARAAALQAIHGERAAWLDDGRVFLEPVVGLPRALLFGGGHVSRAVYRAALEAGFRVTVVDDRPKFAAAERFPDAERIVLPGYRDIASRVRLAPHDYVLVMTRGHQFDEEILDQILRMPPTRYLGVIGSRRKQITAEKRLVARGIPAERFRAIHGPVGLPIGAVTPEEIAVSIVAEMIAARRGAPDDRARALAGRAGRDEA